MPAPGIILRITRSAKRIEDRLLALKEHYPIVVVTHTRAQAKRLADYVVFINLGEVIEHGPAAQVLANPRDGRTATYLAGKFIRQNRPAGSPGRVSPAIADKRASSCPSSTTSR